MAAGRYEWISMHSEAKTFGEWPRVKTGSKEATSLQVKHHGQNYIQKEGQGLNCRGLGYSYFLTVWDIWKNDCLEKKR